MDKRNSLLSTRTKRALPLDVAQHLEDVNTPLFDDALKAFLFAKTSERAAKRTIKNYDSMLRYFKTWLDAFHEGLRLGEITTDIIREYIAWMSTDKETYDNHPYKVKRGLRGLSPVTVNTRIRALKAFFNWCAAEEYIKKSPTRGIKLQRVDTDKIVSFTKEQINALIAAPDINTYIGFRDYVIMITLLDTGLRISELLGLTPDDVDLLQLQLTIPWLLAKTRKERIIPISPLTGKLIAELIRENEDFGTRVTCVFCSGYGRIMSLNSFDDRLREYGEQAGIKTARVSAHTFRHTFALHWIKAGGDPFSLQKILGHTDISMVRRYVRLSDRDVRDKHNQFSPVQTLIKRARS